MRRSPVGPQHDIGVEDRDERIEVAAVRRGEEGVDYFPLAGDIGVGGFWRTGRWPGNGSWIRANPASG
jgi:hypothetical protein